MAAYLPAGQECATAREDRRPVLERGQPGQLRWVVLRVRVDQAATGGLTMPRCANAIPSAWRPARNSIPTWTLSIAQCGGEGPESLQRAVALYGGDLLAGVNGEDAPEFFRLALYRTQSPAAARARCPRFRWRNSSMRAAIPMRPARLPRHGWYTIPANESMHHMLIDWAGESPRAATSAARRNSTSTGARWR